MKKTIKLLVSLTFLMLAFTSCDAIKEKMQVDLNINVPDIDIYVDGQTLVNPASLARVPAAEIVLYEDIVRLDIAAELEKRNFDLDFLKSLSLSAASLILVEDDFTSSNIDLNDYKSLKLYIDDQAQLVAKVKNVDLEQKTIELEMTEYELLDFLEQEELKVILTGEKQLYSKAHFKLKLKFKLRVGLK